MLFEVHHGISTFFDDAIWGSSWYIYILWWCRLRFIMACLHSLMILFEVHLGMTTFSDDAIWGFIKVYLHSLMMLFEGSSRYIYILWWCYLRFIMACLHFWGSSWHVYILWWCFWGSSWYINILWWCFLRFIMVYLHSLMIHQGISTFFDDAIWGFIKVYIYIFWWCYLRVHQLKVYIYIRWWCFLRVHQGISTFSDDAIWVSSWFINIRWWCYMRFISACLHSLMMFFEVYHGYICFLEHELLT